MKITILTFGSRGDVEPYLALALGLKEEGYEVTLAAGQEFKSFILERNIQYAPIGMNFRELLQTDKGKVLLSGDRKLIRKVSKEYFAPFRPKMLNDAWNIAQGSNALIYGHAFYPACYIAEKLNIPSIIASYAPFASPTRAFPYLFLTAKDLGGFLNKLSYEMIRLGGIMEYGITHRWRRETLKLKQRSRFAGYLSINGRPIPVLYGYSRLLLPSPQDWNGNTLISGYWFLDRKKDWQPSRGLESFIANGSHPVYVGFGSMTNKNPERVTEIVVSAIQKSGERGILCSGWGGIVGMDMPDFIYHIDYVPHDWLFPEVKAVIHHGGAGSVGAGLRFGKPTVVCSILPEQHFWGYNIYKCGAGPYPISQLSQKDFTAKRLSEAIKTAVNDAGIRKRAEELGKGVRNEDGIGRAVKFINAQLDEWEKRHK